MSRQKILYVCGLLVVVLSIGGGFVYRDAMLRSALGIPALIVVAIVGTAAVMAGRSSEKLLHESESQFRQLFDISPFPAVVTSLRDNRVLAINQRTSDRFGISQSKAVGAHAPDFYVDPSQRELMVEQLRKHGQVEGLLIQLRTPSASVREQGSHRIDGSAGRKFCSV
jgi:PAS domain S-box-containing protein